MEPIDTARASLPTFSRRWWGYDRKEVEEFLRQTAADRQRHQESLAWLEALMAATIRRRRDAALAAARREAHEARIVALRSHSGGSRGQRLDLPGHAIVAALAFAITSVDLPAPCLYASDMCGAL